MRYTCIFAGLLSVALLAQTTDLAIGTPIDRDVVGLEPQRFQLTAAAGDFVAIDLEQNAADVIVRVTDPQGRLVGEFDSPNGNKGPEPVRFVAPAAGRCEVQV